MKVLAAYTKGKLANNKALGTWPLSLQSIALVEFGPRGSALAYLASACARAQGLL